MVWYMKGSVTVVTAVNGMESIAVLTPFSLIDGPASYNVSLEMMRGSIT